MHIILGSTGHIGSELSKILLEKGEQIIMLTRNAGRAEALKATGAGVAVANVMDTAALHKVFKKGKKLFLLNPPADITTDTAQVERQSIKSIFKAIEGAGFEKIVAESTYGAQPGGNLGDLAVLYEMEQMLQQAGMPYAVIRGAYYYTNWDMSLESAIEEGKIYSMYPPEFKLPMVSPKDIAKLAANLLTEANDASLYFCEGPQHYSAADVAAAFAKALGKEVEVVVTPEEDWVASLKTVGFSDSAAQSMANMTKVTLESKFVEHENTVRGRITLQEHIAELVRSKKK